MTGCNDWRGSSPCEADFYSQTFGVSLREARQRIERIPQLELILEHLRNDEAPRVASWGISHTGSLTAWLQLTGSSPPSDAAQIIADQNHDLEITTGAQHSHATLQAARDRFDDGQDFFLDTASEAADLQPFEFAQAVETSWVDHRANRLVIAIDDSYLPRQLISHMLMSDAGRSSESAVPSSDALFEMLGAVLAEQLAVPVEIVRGWK